MPKETLPPSWIPKDNFSDLLALSLLQGEMDHFVLALISDEASWKKWFKNPLKEAMPKIEMEVESSDGRSFIIIFIFEFLTF